MMVHTVKFKHLEMRRSRAEGWQAGWKPQTDTCEAKGKVSRQTKRNQIQLAPNSFIPFASLVKVKMILGEKKLDRISM